MSQPLLDKVAIVTGAAGGIGAAIARRLSADGARLVLADINADRVQQEAASLGSAKSVLAVRCDVGALADVQACVSAALQRFGALDIIINNAGLMAFKSLDAWSDEDWLRLLKVDFLGAAFFIGEAFRHMKNGGVIVNVASVHAVQTTANVAPYAAAKAALVSLTHSAAIEGRERNIRCNVLLPGAIDTPMLWSNPNLKTGAEKLDKADIGVPEDVAAAAAFLCSSDARFITGAALAVDGGRLAAL